MSGLDVEALLESTAASQPQDYTRESQDRDDDRSRSEQPSSERRDRDRERRRRDRSRGERRRERDADGDEDMKSPRSEHGSANGSHRSSRKRSRSRDSRRSRRDRDRYGDDYRSSGGDFYRGGGRARTRSRSPVDDRYYRPSGRQRRDEEERRYRRRDSRRRSPTPKGRSKSPELTEDERDRRTIFVQQLAARLRTKELIGFFEKVGPVKEAQIVKDRVSGRSKGYVPPRFFFFFSVGWC